MCFLLGTDCVYMYLCVPYGSHSIVPVKSLHLQEGQTGNAWEPSKPIIYSVPPTRSVSHYYPLLSLLHSHGSHIKQRLFPQTVLTGWTL
jgi:hypothetical protein